MIQFLEILSSIINLAYTFIFFWLIHTFLPLRKNWPMRILAFFVCNVLSLIVVYSNDLANLLGALLGVIAYIAIFHCGKWVEKMTAVLIFYPALIAVNYLMQDIGSTVFFWVTEAPPDPNLGWTEEQMLISTAFYTVSLLLRFLFWFGAWRFLRKYLKQITSNLTTRMWLIVDTLMLASFVAIFIIIYFMPENPMIVYPICGASIFSSFGCIYLASYICNAVQTEYYAQELETKQAYYKDRMNEEKRVRSIYHDMKNHLLVLQAQAKNSQTVQESIRNLQSQIQEYENYHHTGNDFLDIIIRDKARIAQQKEINFTPIIHFEDGGFIDPLDISTIFGNALDNAIEASEKLPNQERLITVKANRIRDMLVIAIENHTMADSSDTKGTTKTDRFVHGFGLPNIKKVAEKYNGQCITKCEKGIFTLKIIIPIA